MLLPGEILIHAGNAHQFTVPPAGQGMGLIPRDFVKVPCGSMPGAPMTARAKIPRSEWPERIRDLTAAKALLSDVRNTGMNGGVIPSRDQNGRGYCWAHSTVSAALIARAKANAPFADLSAYAIACIIKNYRDEGGWNGESMEFLRGRGCPTSEFWPQQGTSRSFDKPETWANAALYKDTEWEDIAEGDFDMQMTLLLEGCPHPLDLNWWSHSICACDPVDGVSGFTDFRLESGKLATMQEFDVIWEVAEFGAAYGIRIWNSWGDSWGANGMGTLTESKARNNGAISLRVMKA
jgi:hypothetical protein